MRGDITRALARRGPRSIAHRAVAMSLELFDGALQSSEGLRRTNWVEEDWAHTSGDPVNP